MNILSYRGPSTAGGVSSALARIIETCADGNQRWWYMDASSMQTRTSAHSNPETICSIPKEVIYGHYSYCNSFIWPVLHDLPQHATLSMRDRRHYRQFNKRFAGNLLHSGQLQSENCFVNDYQLALATGLLARAQALNIILFWHVPWPTDVAPAHAPYLAEIAEGLLGARRIGFHTDEYAANFLHFVQKHCPNYRVDIDGRSIVSHLDENLVTELVAVPLGLDYAFWQQSTVDCSPLHKDMDVRKQIPGQFVLSVDRADYTKGVLERMEAIDTYFEQNPHRLGKITFVQVCQPTRTGLPAFDQYWQKCRTRAEELNSRWSTSDQNWKPVSWIDKPVPPKVLAWLYSKAESMLINPVRDGLNLTAKEFAVCSTNGALILSRGAGVWHEIGGSALGLRSLSADEIATQIESALNMSLEEKRRRLLAMKRTIKMNTLNAWWRRFGMGVPPNQTVVLFPARKQQQAAVTGELLLAK